MQAVELLTRDTSLLTDVELRDLAVQHLRLTTIGYKEWAKKVEQGRYPNQGKDTQWYMALDLLKAIDDIPPAPVPVPDPNPVPDPVPVPIPQGLRKFGLSHGATVINRDQGTRDFELDQTKAVGSQSSRLDIWRQGESSSNRAGDQVRQRGMDVLLCLGGTFRGPWNDPNGYAAWMGQQASALGAKQRLYEFFNEPDLNGATPQTYAQHFKAGKAAVKKANPNAICVFGALWKGAGGPQAFVQAGIDLGCFDETDVVSMHLYDDALERGSWNIWDMAYPWQGGYYNGNTVREILDRSGLHIPIISTESGAPIPKYSVQRQADIVKHALEEVKKGKIAAVYVYTMMDDDVSGFGMLDGNRQKRLSWDAYKLAAV